MENRTIGNPPVEPLAVSVAVFPEQTWPFRLPWCGWYGINSNDRGARTCCPTHGVV